MLDVNVRTDQPVASEAPQFSSVEEAIDEIRAGRFVVVADDEGRENEGDLICAAELVTPAMINFMISEARGWVCLALTADRARQLELPPMVEVNTDAQGTAFTVTIDADTRFGVTTGISAYDRATTIRVAADPACRPGDLRRPGHVAPLVARAGGVLQRAGHTEAAVDLARLAGISPAGVICEVINLDGTMARVPELAAFAARHKLKFVNIAQLIPYRLRPVHPLRLSQPARRHRAPGAGGRRGERAAGRSGARAQRVPDRRRVRQPALRLRSAAGGGDGHDRRRGHGRARLSAPGGKGNRSSQQGKGLRPAGRRSGHRAGQRVAGLQARPARLRGRRPDPL